MTKVAAVIPAYNEAANIGRVLQRLVRCAQVDEIIVVCDGCEDDTAAVAGRYRVSVIELPINVGKGGAMMAGVEHTDAEVILFLDADLIGLRHSHIRVARRSRRGGTRGYGYRHFRRRTPGDRLGAKTRTVFDRSAGAPPRNFRGNTRIGSVPLRSRNSVVSLRGEARAAGGQGEFAGLGASDEGRKVGRLERIPGPDANVLGNHPFVSVTSLCHTDRICFDPA